MDNLDLNLLFDEVMFSLLRLVNMWCDWFRLCTNKKKICLVVLGSILRNMCIQPAVLLTSLKTRTGKGSTKKCHLHMGFRQI